MERMRVIDRREFLATAAGGITVGTAGCADRVTRNVDRSTPGQVSLTITTVPNDEDPKKIRIARQFVGNLEAVGIDATLEPQTEQQLLRDVLFEHEFDVFVTEHPGVPEPLSLRPLLHSRFAEENGWQNPFGFSSPRVDDLLDRQLREEGTARQETVSEIQREILREQPFSVLAYADHETAVSELTATEWSLGGLSSFDSLLSISDNPQQREVLRIGVLSPQITENRNPLAVEFPARDPILDLIYDPLLRVTSGGYIPWLATEWSTGDDTISVELRDDVFWHDGEPLTQEDIVFTYRFLADTALGNADSPVPAPRFRDRSSLVDSVSAIGERGVTLELIEPIPTAKARILTVPILPEHKWRDRTEIVRETLTDAVINNNEEPIGSGPLQFVSADRDSQAVLARWDEHFLNRAGETDELAPFSGPIPFEQLVISIEPSALSALELLDNDDLDAVASPLDTNAIATALTMDNVRLLSEQTNSFYMIGYNTRRHPLGNHSIRSVLSRLLDRSQIVSDVFDERATAAETPVLRSAHVPDDIEWSGESALGPFPGSDGDLDVEAARELFREAGFRFNEEDQLVTQ